MTSPMEIAGALREIARYLELEGDGHRARAYEKAAASVEGVQNLDRHLAEERLTELPYVGASLARTIAELAARGTTDALEQLRAAWPKIVLALAGVPGVGAKKARKLHDALAPTSLAQVAELGRAGAIRAVPGFAAKSEAQIVAAIEQHQVGGGAMPVGEARELTAQLVAWMAGAPSVSRCEPGGPARRWIEEVEHLAIAVATDDVEAALAHLARHPQVAEIAAAAPVARALLAGGARLEVYLSPAARFGVAALLATGPEAHLAALGARAAARGETLAGLAGVDEDALYAALGLPSIPPELRDGSDELELAERGGLGGLLTRADVRGAVHCHTVYSDGKHTIEQMARAAEAAGLGYITITDHSPAAGYAGGLDVERLKAQWDEIAEVQEKVAVRLLRGSEVDILEDGALDFPDAVLDQLDVVIASIHRRHQLDEAAMTERVVRAMRHPRFKIWGHPLGRLVLRRPPIPLRFEDVLDAIAASPAAIEISGDPHRLDLPPELARRARERGLRFVVSTDAHSINALGYLDAAVALARRARLTPADVLNTLPADAFARAVAAA